MEVPWQLARNGYQLNHAGLHGTVALRGTAPGLRELSLVWGAERFRWLGPVLAVRAIQVSGKPPCPIRFATSRPNHRLRANVLDVVVDETTRCPARLQIYWSTARARQIGIMEMEVLVTTARPFDRLEVITWSELPAKEPAPASECLVCLAVDPPRWVDVREASRIGADWLVVPRDRDAAILSLDGRSPPLGKTILAPTFQSPIVCYRPAARSWSYVEMTHVEDCARIIARCHRGKIEWGFGLFGLDIEKGVILRGRVRGLFVPRRGDLSRAEKSFREFVALPPRLSV